MTQTVDYDIVGSYNNQRVSSIDAERSINLFEYIDPLGKKPKSLINTSGLTDSGSSFNLSEDDPTLVTGGFRAQFVFKTFEYDVVGNSVYKTNSSGVAALIGTISSSSGYVGVDANTFQVIFVNGKDGYIWDITAQTFTHISDTSFPVSPIDVCYLDGFFVVADGGTNNFQLSSFNQGLVWGSDDSTFTADDTGGNNWLILASTDNYRTGVPFTLSNSGGALPTPLVADTTYYAITVFSMTNVIDPLHIRVATTYANAIAGTAIVLSDNGSGTNTITSDGQLQLGSITSHPGTITACRTLHRRLFLFSQNFTEVWENAGLGTNLPFRRSNSLLMEYGTPAIGSVSVGFDMMFFLSQDRDGLGSVMMVRGSESIPVSNRALDFQYSQYAADGNVADCRSFLIKENGIIFYRMNFTAANATYVYNVTFSDPTQEQGKLWHEEQVLNGDRHPSQTHAYFNGINYVGNYESPIRYVLSSDVFTNDGENIRRTRITKAFVPPGYERIRIDRLQIDLLQGTITQGFDQPFVYLSISKDGGQTYGNTISSPMGLIGQRTFRTVWRKLGTIPRGQAFVSKFEFFYQAPFVILGAAWAIEVMPE